MKSKIIILLSLLFIFKVEAQINNRGFRLEVDIPTQKNNKIYLGQYWNNAIYAIDSLQLSSSGNAAFMHDQELPQGQYFIHIKPAMQVDFLVGENQNNIHLYLNETDFKKNTVKGSNDTRLLWKYLAYMDQKSLKKSELNKQLSDSLISEKERADINRNILKLDSDMQKYIDSFTAKHRNEWAGIFIKGLNQVVLPYPQPKDKKELLINQKYYKEHFFDNINLTDPRFWRTNYFNVYINNYMRQCVDQWPDSLAAAASRLVAKTEGNDFCFKQMLSKLTNESIKSMQMGDENIWARLFEDYIIDKNLSWIDSTQLLELNRMHETIKYNRIGMTAQNLKLVTIDGDTINTNELEAELLLICFYDPSCIHCMTELPKIHNELYPKYKKNGFEVVALNIASDVNEWKEFIGKNNLSDWINCADPDYKSKYWMYFDTTGVPVTFVLNRNKKIIAKKIHDENLATVLDYYLKDKDGTN